MTIDIDPNEFRIIKKIINWDKYRRKTETFINNLILIFGLLLIIITIYYSIKSVNHHLILYIAAPGLLSGILLVWLYSVNRNIFSEKREITKFFTKLLENKRMS